MADFELNIDEGALEALLDDEAGDVLQDVGDQIADRAADAAPKRTGAGAASIQAVVSGSGDDKHVDVSWDPAHDYMKYAETGNERQAATPFLRPALDATHI